MQNALFQAICRMGIFMICAQAVIHFRPKEVYEKYLKLLVSVMVLIQIFLPIGSILLGKGGQGAADALEQFRREMEESMEEASENTSAADALLEQMTLEEIRNRLEAQSQDQEGGQDGEDWKENPGSSDGQEKTEEGELQRNDAGYGAAGEAGSQKQGVQEADSAAGTIEISPGSIEPIVISPVQQGTTE